GQYSRAADRRRRGSGSAAGRRSVDRASRKGRAPTVLSAQSNQIGAPQPLITNKPPAEQNGGYRASCPSPLVTIRDNIPSTNHSALDALRTDLRLAIWRGPTTHVTHCSAPDYVPPGIQQCQAALGA